MRYSFSLTPKIAAGEAKLTEHGGQETRCDFLAEVFDDRLPGTVVERDMAPLAAFGFHPNGQGPRCTQLAHPLNEFPTFDPVTIGQECPNSNHRLVQRLGRQGLYPPRLPLSKIVPDRTLKLDLHAWQFQRPTRPFSIFRTTFSL